MKKYDHKKIEKKWVKAWDKSGIYTAADKSEKPKYYALVEFPYPSGVGLHVGHIRSNTAMDIIARKRRMEGHNVLYPMGWDAFGLPTENYAIKTGIAPQVATKKNTETFKKQLKAMGFSFDWTREIDTTDPKYYKWTQWMFLQFFKHGLAYKAKAEINWCPKDKIGLANEEVENGKCERCGGPVEKRQKEQWMLKMSSYSEKLLSGLKGLDFIPEVSTSQENWIGKSEGAEIEFPIVIPVTEPESTIKRFILLHGRTGRPTKNFHPWLKKELENKGYEVLAPELPNADDPNDEEQMRFVRDTCKPDESTAIIAHSFGGIVALRLLEQGIKLHSAIFVATPITGKFLDGKDRPSVSAACAKGFNFEKIKANAQSFTVLADEKDEVVPMSDAEELAKSLSVVPIKAVGQSTHFTGNHEPAVLSAVIASTRSNPVKSIKVFTTRPDTIFGATYLVISPEHPLLDQLKLNNEIGAYRELARKRSDIERTSENKEKTGVELKGVRAINPATKEEIPVWISDYVLAGYGTGAIMAVPAHDRRDFDFAKQHQLVIKEVIIPMPSYPKGTILEGTVPTTVSDTFPYAGEGALKNSGKFDGLPTIEARRQITNEFGKTQVTYKLRDWVFSRQRYWGEPIPLIYCPACYESDLKANSSKLTANLGWIPVSDEKLPVKLPKVEKYQPTDNGESPLSKIEKWMSVKCPNCGGSARRETDTMPNWAGSSWYYMAYLLDKKTFDGPASSENWKLEIENLRQWLPVDWYNGGMEHATRHLLYARFWNQFFHDIGEVPVSEPFKKRTAHGMILGADGVKMSKSVGNVVNPEELINEFGADALRMYEMFIGPFDQMVAWDPRGILGTARFLEKVWRIASVIPAAEPESTTKDGSRVKPGMTQDGIQKLLHKTIKKVSEDIEKMSFNTAVSAMMVFVNETQTIPDEFLKLLAPFAPFMSEELWTMRGSKESIHTAPWPEFDSKLLVEESFDMVVQINGRVRGKISAPMGINEADAIALALTNEDIKRWMAPAGGGQAGEPKKVIFVPNRLINLIF